MVGEWSVDLWLFSIGGSFDKVFGSDRPPVQLPSVDPLPELVAALRDTHNWSAPLPERAGCSSASATARAHRTCSSTRSARSASGSSFYRSESSWIVQ